MVCKVYDKGLGAWWEQVKVGFVGVVEVILGKWPNESLLTEKMDALQCRGTVSALNNV